MRNHLSRRAILAAAAAAAATASFSRPAAAQSFPTRLVTLLVPFPAGSATDGVARKIADHLRTALNQNVIVDNKPGADGIIAARLAAAAEPDGHTIFVTTNTTHAANVNIYTSLPYDPQKDFLPVGGIMKIPMMLAVKPDFPANNLAEFIQVAKSRKLSFGSGNTSSRGAAEMLKARAGLDMLHVPYRGTPQALTDLIAGNIDMMCPDPSSALGAIEGRQIKILAVASSARMKKFPDIPTIAESGFPGFEMVAWVGAFVPARTPAATVARLNEELNAILKRPDVLGYLDTIAAPVYPTTPDELRAFVEEDVRRWKEIVELAGIEKKPGQ